MRILFLFSLALAIVPLLAGEVTHVVQKNETLGGIARKYGVSTAAIQSFNGISNPNLLFAGKKLKIPSATASQIEYVIKTGDSLGGIASRFGVKTSDLIEVNGINQPNLIKVGQKITIPLGKTKKPPATPMLPASILKTLKSITNSSRWKRIVIHHSATPVDDAMNMHNVHKNQRGMKNGLAYHFVISNGSRKASDGEIHIGGRWKGQLDGGHMKQLSLNKTSVGICLIGNFELQRPTSKQLKSLEALCKHLMKSCRISHSSVTTHKLLHPNHTKCPGKHFSLPSLLKKIKP
jgi:LysM repeat protein